MSILLIIVVLVAAFKVQSGFKKGMVKELISLVTLLVTAIMIALLACAFHTYMKKEIVGLIITVILLVFLGSINHFLKIIFFSLKAISKLPVVSLLNKLLGAVFGFCEVVVLLQLLYFMINTFGLGKIGSQIVTYTMNTPVLYFFYQHNWVADLLNRLVQSIGSSVA